jgi:predicted kinase
MSKSVVIILRGAPGAGKSTIASNIVCNGYLNTGNFGYVNKDKLRQKNPLLPERDIHALQTEKILLNLNSGNNFIVDNTHSHVRAVNEVKAMAAQYGANVFTINLFETIPVSVAIKQDLKRIANEPDKYVGASVIRKMYMDYARENKRSYSEFGDIEYSATESPVLVDVDGTVALIPEAHRLRYLGSTKKDWDGFYSEIPNFKPNLPVIKAVNALRVAWPIKQPVIFVSGRNENYRAATEAWLRDVVGIPYFMLLMRGFNNFKPDTEVKERLFNDYIAPNFEVKDVIIFDDRNSVVQKWRDMGLTCFQVAEGDF